jgi:hypothetical protein
LASMKRSNSSLLRPTEQIKMLRPTEATPPLRTLALLAPLHLSPARCERARRHTKPYYAISLVIAQHAFSIARAQ